MNIFILIIEDIFTIKKYELIIGNILTFYSVDESGNTPVFVAVQHGNLPVVKFFIDE